MFGLDKPIPGVAVAPDDPVAVAGPVDREHTSVRGCDAVGRNAGVVHPPGTAGVGVECADRVAAGADVDGVAGADGDAEPATLRDDRPLDLCAERFDGGEPVVGVAGDAVPLRE